MLFIVDVSQAIPFILFSKALIQYYSFIIINIKLTITILLFSYSVITLDTKQMAGLQR